MVFEDCLNKKSALEADFLLGSSGVKGIFRDFLRKQIERSMVYQVVSMS